MNFPFNEMCGDFRVRWEVSVGHSTARCQIVRQDNLEVVSITAETPLAAMERAAEVYLAFLRSKYAPRASTDKAVIITAAALQKIFDRA